MSPVRTPRPAIGLRTGKDLVDEVNRRVLDALGEDPRLSAAELGRRVGLSAPAVRERVARLEEAGVIRGYRLDIDPAALGLPVSVWVRLRPTPGSLPKAEQLARQVPEVSECHRISGEDCLLLRVHVPAIEALEGVLDQFLLYGQTTSSFIVSTPVPPRSPRPGGTLTQESLH
ncbi:Lrp/AsnC family transcriptional regulator [Geodermatophilus sp. SYSU D00700]